MRANPFEDIEELLERMSEQVEEGMTFDRSVPVDVRETEAAFVVTVDLPGYDADEIDLTVTDRQLRIDAERETDVELEDDEGVRTVRRERTRTSVSRSVRLPEPVDEESVEASLDGGVLTVTLPREHDEEGRTIEIEDD